MRILVDVPTDDMRRERVERATFARLDAIREVLTAPSDDVRRERIEHGVVQQLAVARGQEHVAYALRPRRRWLPVAGLAFAAAIALVVVLRGTDPGVPSPTITQHVVPAGAGSSWSSSEAVVSASANTVVDERIDDSGVTLALARGKVECEVEPRPGRAPFRVVAGEVTVTVVGTRFSVERGAGGVRVEVVRGRVHVAAPGVDKLLAAGETWTNAVVAAVPAAEPPDAGIDETAIELALDPKPAIKQPTAKEIYDNATALERRDPAAAARLYRRAANMREPRYAALALYSLADVERSRAPASALRAIDEYLQRFPAGVNVEDLLWTRVDIYRATGQRAPMQAAASAYLRRFPGGTYAAKARKLAE